MAGSLGAWAREGPGRGSGMGLRVRARDAFSSRVGVGGCVSKAAKWHCLLVEGMVMACRRGDAVTGIHTVCLYSE